MYKRQGNTLYFTALSPGNGYELWKSDGTASGTVMVKDIRSGSGHSTPADLILVGNTLYFTALDGIHGRELWALDPDNITGLNSGSGGGSGGGMTNVTGATSCTASPNLPTGLNIDSSTCTISGTPTAEAVNATYEITATISGITYKASIWLSVSPYGTITSAVEGAALNLSEAMTPITLNYTSSTNVNAASTVFGNRQISTGSKNACIILQNQSLMCWGLNSDGQLGVGNSTSYVNTPVWVDFGFDAAVSTVSNGPMATCAILTNGSLYCWGDVHGSTPTSTTPKHVDLPPGRTVIEVSVGDRNTCLILDNGSISCIGSGSGGVNGDGSPTSFPAAASEVGDSYVLLPTGRTAVSVSIGYRHGCAVLDNGSAMCWGIVNQGTLGDGSTTSDTSVPVYVSMPTGSTTQAISAGDKSTCAIIDNGSVYCWGMGSNGQLGQGYLDHNGKNTPQFVDLGAGRSAVAIDTSISVGTGTMTNLWGHACAVLDNGSTKCWGSNANSAYVWVSLRTASDNGTPIVSNPYATEDAIAVGTGSGFTCTVYASGTIECIGQYYGLGSGSSYNYWNSTIPVGNPSVDTTTVSVTWETHPALPAGMSISGGTISGTPSVYALNQTYTIYANQSGYSTTHEVYFSVDTDNAHTVVENQAIDPIGFHPPFNNGTTCWSVSPALPGNLSIDSSTGEITGSVNGTLTNTTYTVTANHGCTGSGTGGGSGSGTTTYGNGSTWNALDLYGSQNGKVGMNMFQAVGDTIYFSAFDGVSTGTQSTMWAYDTSNGSAWQLTGVTSSGFGPGYHGMTMVVGDTIYFSNTEYGTTGNELWAHDTSNGSSWRVADLNSGCLLYTSPSPRD